MINVKGKNLLNETVLKEISIADLVNYLVALGWSAVEDIEDKAIVFGKPEVMEEIVIPIRKDLGDYTLRLSEAITILAKTEDMSHDDIILNIEKF